MSRSCIQVFVASFALWRVKVVWLQTFNLLNFEIWVLGSAGIRAPAENRLSSRRGFRRWRFGAISFHSVGLRVGGTAFKMPGSESWPLITLPQCS